MLKLRFFIGFFAFHLFVDASGSDKKSSNRNSIHSLESLVDIRILIMFFRSSFSDENNSSTEKSFDSLLKDTICSFVRSQVLFVAVRLDLFTKINQSPRRCLSFKEIKNLNVPSSMISYLIYLRLIERCPNSFDYRCTQVSRKYLISTNPNYVGLGLGVWDYRRQYKFFMNLEETIVTGRRTSEDAQEESSLWNLFQQKQDPMIYFARIMSSFTRCTINELCDHVDFSNYSTFLDIGGSLGELSRTLIERNPHLTALSLDLPVVVEYAVLSNGENSRVEFIAADFFDDDWPLEIQAKAEQIDLITIKYILHDWPQERRLFLLKKMFRLLREKVELCAGHGTLLVIEKMIDNERKNITSLSTSISMAIECGDGVGYDATKTEYEQLILQAGFQRVQAIHLMGPMVALLAEAI